METMHDGSDTVGEIGRHTVNVDTGLEERQNQFRRCDVAPICRIVHGKGHGWLTPTEQKDLGGCIIEPSSGHLDDLGSDHAWRQDLRCLQRDMIECMV